MGVAAGVSLDPVREALLAQAEAEAERLVGQAEDPLGIPRTLLMIVETQERNAAGGLEREYSYSTYNDSTLVPTTFVPN